MTLSILNAIGCVLCSDINCFDEATTKDPNPVVSLQAWSISILKENRRAGQCLPQKDDLSRGGVSGHWGEA